MSLSGIAAKAAIAATITLTLAGVGRANDIKGKVTAQGIKSAENIAVYIDVIAGKKFDPPADHVVIDQRKMTFVPHVVVVQKGPPWIS